MTHPRSARLAASGAFAAQGFAYALVLTNLPTFEARYAISTGANTADMHVVGVRAAGGPAAADRIARGRGGSRAALATGLGALLVALVGIAVAPAFAAAVVAFACYGLGRGLVDAGGNMLAVAVQQAYGRSLLVSFHGACSAAGTVGARVVSAAAGRWPEDPVLWVILLGVPVAAAAAVLVVRSGWRGRGASSVTLPAGRTVPWRPLVLLGVCVVAFYIVDSAVSSWSALFLDDLGAHVRVEPLGYAAYLGAALLTRVVGDRAVQRWGRATVVRVAGVVGAVALVLVLVSRAPWMAVVAFAVTGVLSVVPPLAFSAAGDVAPGAADLVVARLNYFNYVGVVLGAVVVGAVGTPTSLRVGFVVPALLVLAVPLVAGVLRVPGAGAGGRGTAVPLAAPVPGVGSAPPAAPAPSARSAGDDAERGSGA